MQAHWYQLRDLQTPSLPRQSSTRQRGKYLASGVRYSQLPTGHTVWYFYKLVPWGGVLDREADGAGVNAYKKDNDHGMGHCPFFQLFIGNFLSS